MLTFVPILLFVTYAFSASVNPFDETTSRYVTVYGDSTAEIIDTEAPAPQPTASIDEITLHFYSKNNPIIPEDYPLDAAKVISSSNFNRRKLNIFIIHGWVDDHLAEVNSKVRDASLLAEDANVFVVDWGVPASGLYTKASSNVQTVGNALGAFIVKLQETLRIGADKFKIVGFSLGAHVAGNAGRTAKGEIQTIVALDPAGPLFSRTHSNARLSKDDAKQVHVIHTNGGKLGYSDDLGHADFRPNGGSTQPGCGRDLTGQCSHERSYKYYAESILTGGFDAYECGSENRYNLGLCDNNPKVRMGGLPVDSSATGTYFLKTHEDSYFSL